MSTLDPSAPGNALAFYAFGPFVILTATVTVDGEPVTVHQHVDRAVWQRIAADPPTRADYERRLRYDLAVALVDRLDPTITVHDLTPPDEAVRNEPEPEQGFVVGAGTLTPSLPENVSTPLEQDRPPLVSGH